MSMVQCTKKEEQTMRNDVKRMGTVQSVAGFFSGLVFKTTNGAMKMVGKKAGFDPMSAFNATVISPEPEDPMRGWQECDLLVLIHVAVTLR